MSDWHLEETYKGRITLSIEVMRVILAINGGAAIAVLSFWGHSNSTASMPLRMPLLAFGIGIAIAALTTVVAYVAQSMLYVEEANIKGGLEVKRRHVIWITAGVALSILAIIAFIVGCFLTANALSAG